MNKRFSTFSGLDPAAPFYEANSMRLSRNDAYYVDIMHTSSMGLIEPIGHVDYYVNGGS
jgi:hypothetical protein